MKQTGMIGEMIFFQIRKRPPRSNATALTSPTDPPMNPRNISIFAGRSATLPSCSTPSGVALVAASTVDIDGVGHVVISVAKEINNTILAVMAGLTTFLPRPP